MRKLSLCFLLLFVGSCWAASQKSNLNMTNPKQRQISLSDGWLLKNSSLVPEEAAVVSSGKFVPKDWYPTSVPSTVLNALIKNGVYPDMRIGLNNFLIPDSSDKFNEIYDLVKYSHLPGKRNPWKDPYWYRKEFTIARSNSGKRVWLNFKGINYRGDVWLNGKRIAEHQEMVGMYQRFRFDITDFAKIGKNYLAVKIYPVDHPGMPDPPSEVLGRSREFRQSQNPAKDLMKDVTFVMGIGYDCMPTVRDRSMGLWQKVYIDFTGAVDIRHPFVVTDLPLPKTNSASLTISADLVNATQSPQKGVCKGVVKEAGVKFEKNVELGPGETRRIVFSPDEFPQLVLDNPRLWWPVNYGPQNLYNLSLSFEANKKSSDEENVTFGVREVGKEMHQYGKGFGMRVIINGKKIFSQGGWLQPEILFAWDEKSINAEIRYLTEANLNTVTFEDIPMPPDEFLEACDRAGLMFWNCFYSSHWTMQETGNPLDHDLLERCTVDIIKRYRNHPSLVLYSALGEYVPSEDVYKRWCRSVNKLDTTRLTLPSIWVSPNKVVEWIKKDVPTGVSDAHAFQWEKPANYYRQVRKRTKSRHYDSADDWMFNTEVSIASVPPIDSLQKFILDLGQKVEGAPCPLTATWAHHGANGYYKGYDKAIRRLYGHVDNVEDYCMKGHLVTATQHRAWSEAVNHRMWDVTSGVWQWKLNSCWPSVQWQIYDWYLKPMVSLYYYKSAFEPLHVQLSPLDSMVTVVNRRLEAKEDLEVSVKIFDFDMNLKWRKKAKTGVGANTYKDVFKVPVASDMTNVYFAKLELKDGNGKLVSDNFYWLYKNKETDYRALSQLPRTKLDVSCRFKSKSGQNIAHVTVKNPTDKLAFFIHAAITKGRGGQEILPVFWDDNYFSLLPGQTKELRAEFEDTGKSKLKPVIEVGGWNIQTDYECNRINTAKNELLSNEEFTIVATIKNTFIDGSLVDLLVDNKIVATKRIYARRKSRDIDFTLKLSKPGPHTISVADQTLTVQIK